jgi:hypothetical protein
VSSLPRESCLVVRGLGAEFSSAGLIGCFHEMGHAFSRQSQTF